MNKWRKRLYGFTGLFILISIWMPMLSFISSAKRIYELETFEVLAMPWFGVLMYIALLIATLIAQGGLIVLAHDLSEQFESLKRQRAEH